MKLGDATTRNISYASTVVCQEASRMKARCERVITAQRDTTAAQGCGHYDVASVCSLSLSYTLQQ